MGCIVPEDAKTLKAQIFDLSEKAAKQALFGMVQILEQHPSILMNVFKMIIEDAGTLTKVVKENGYRRV